MIKVENLCKSFRTEDVETIALNNVSVTVEDGEFVAIMGPNDKSRESLQVIPHRRCGDDCFK